jgi:hypothetical protein
LLLIAKNLGHADTRIVAKHYGHLASSYIVNAMRVDARSLGSRPMRLWCHSGGESVAKRGRPRGTGGPTHWSRNPANVAAHHASLLMELWLAAAPITEVAKLFLWSPEHQDIIEECWSKRGCERRYTVPKAVKLQLCKLAIAYVMELHRQAEDARPEIEASPQSAAGAKLRDRGWTNEEIAAWFKKLSERARKRSKKEFKKPSVERVFEIATRRAPAVTLRRKARSP